MSGECSSCDERIHTLGLLIDDAVDPVAHVVVHLALCIVDGTFVVGTGQLAGEFGAA